MRATIAVPVKAVLTGQILIRKGRIWTARLRIDHVVIFQASAPRIFNAAGLIAPAAVGDLAAIASVADSAAAIASAVEVDLAVSAEIALAAGDLEAAASADSVVEDSAVFVAADDKIKVLN